MEARLGRGRGGGLQAKANISSVSVNRGTVMCVFPPCIRTYATDVQNAVVSSADKFFSLWIEDTVCVIT